MFDRKLTGQLLATLENSHTRIIARTFATDKQNRWVFVWGSKKIYHSPSDFILIPTTGTPAP